MSKRERREYSRRYYSNHKERLNGFRKELCPFCKRLKIKNARMCHKCFLRGPNNHFWKGGRIATVLCAQCGNKLKRLQWYLEKSKSRLFFCNRKCKAEYEMTSNRGSKGANYKHGKYSSFGICKTCGKKFERRKYKLRKYCSKKCRPIGGYLYVKGRRFEYRAMSILRRMGFHAIYRSPRSLGIFDIFALKGDPTTREIAEARYIQVKAARSPFPLKSIVRKKERRRIARNKMVLMVGRKTFYEIWIRRLNKRWDVYRLNWASREFDLLNPGEGFESQ